MKDETRLFFFHPSSFILHPSGAPSSREQELMASDPSAPNPQPGGLQSMLDRLKGLTRSLSGDEPEEELLPTFDLPTATPAPTPVEPLQAIPVDPLPEAAPETVPPPTEAPPPVESPPPTRCPVCNSERVPGYASCVYCVYHVIV